MCEAFLLPLVEFIAITFLLSSGCAASQKFSGAVLLFLSQDTFNSRFVSSLNQWLFKNVFFSFHLFLNFPSSKKKIQFYSIVVGKETWNDFYILKCVKTCWVTECVISHGGWSLCARDECVFFSLGLAGCVHACWILLADTVVRATC